LEEWLPGGEIWNNIKLFLDKGESSYRRKKILGRNPMNLLLFLSFQRYYRRRKEQNLY
jgi:hypothetical protein